MEDPKSFSAPVTSLNEATAPTDRPSSSPPRKSQDNNEQQAKSESSGSTKVGVPKDGADVDTADPGALEANVPRTSSVSNNNKEQEKSEEPVDPNIVDWDGPDDPTNPMNWPPWKVKAHIFLVSAITFVT